MRTRRSPRNQERLWRALGGPQKAKPKRTRLTSRAEARAKLFPKETAEMTKEEEKEVLDDGT